MTTTGSDWFAHDDASFLQAVLSSAGIALIAADEHLKVRLWNRASAHVFGAASEAMLHTPLPALIPAEARAAAEQAFRRALDQRESSDLEFRYPDEHGRFRELAANITPLISPDGATRGVLLSARDITRRFEAERRVAESHKMNALGDMAGAVAHHFNNILGGITTTVDFALAAGDEGMLREALEKTAASSARAAHLVRGLLSFAEGDRRGDRTADIKDILHQTEQEFRERCMAGGIKLSVEVDSGIALQAPRLPMLTVLRQLIQNAIEAMPAGGRLSVGLGDELGRRVIAVEDSGPGLPPEVLSRVFEPFFRAGEPIDATGHSGLGLSIVYGIVRGLGGTIEASSKLGAGVRIRILLPPTIE